MPLRIKPVSLIFLLLIVCSSSLAITEGSIQLGGAKMHESIMIYKIEDVEMKKMPHRKLMFPFTTADYDDAGPNPKHDPRGRHGGKA